MTVTVTLNKFNLPDVRGMLHAALRPPGRQTPKSLPEKPLTGACCGGISRIPRRICTYQDCAKIRLGVPSGPAAGLTSLVAHMYARMTRRPHTANNALIPREAARHVSASHTPRSGRRVIPFFCAACLHSPHAAQRYGGARVAAANAATGAPAGYTAPPAHPHPKVPTRRVRRGFN